MSFAPLLKQSITGMMTLFLLLFSLSANAVLSAEKTPSDVYRQVQLLSKNHISSPWPTVAPEQGRAPRHVFQKTLEILDKINLYRINVAHSGAITVPRFPGRDITPNEVYAALSEISIALDESLVLEVERRAGMFQVYDFSVSPADETQL